MRYLVVAAMLVSSGCGDGLTIPRGIDTSNLAADEQLARATAAALRLPEHATFLRDQLRASPYTRHRVSLQDLLRSSSAAGFTGEIARQMKVTPEALLVELRSAPALNIWMPSKAQRTSWKGTPDAVVTATFGENSTGKRAFASAGEGLMSEALRNNPRYLSENASPVFMIAPSPGLNLRPATTPEVGLVVQNPGELDYGGRKVEFDRTGDSTVTQLAPMMKAAYARAA